MKIFDAQGTAALTPYPALIDALRIAALEVAAGAIACPQRAALALPAGGILLSMIASGADLALHKLVTVVADNPSHGLPAVQSQVTVWDARNGTHLMTLDGAALTGRRTAALSLLGVSALSAHRPNHIRLFGTGVQAQHHLEAITQIYPQARVVVSGRTPEATEKFRRAHATVPNLSVAPSAAVAEEVDVVICCTTSRDAVYEAPARSGRLVIAVGSFTPEAAEVGAATVRASQIFVDDLAGARAEAGDLIRADIDWAQVQPLARRLSGEAALTLPALYKTVGCAAWDLAAARVAVAESSQ